ncbi:hypothetical protein BpOF4_06750 [Alkalihalophilus pseudofirmus OF4]|uniref:Uncharacterized protein n=1 Tax=Alkalihalophilus pseudofirmus (strain ATCC BAA-2126 / JCM 17055 / OF4) TaxID=398511 RepID=D3G0D3_ALKPO|nr:hypothetical protein BpOF4_06750 [Alkalihalophilus pseudofirmus OF4]
MTGWKGAGRIAPAQRLIARVCLAIAPIYRVIAWVQRVIASVGCLCSD